MNSSESSSFSAEEREALLETIKGYKVQTKPSPIFSGQCGVIAIAPIKKGEPVFPCNGELSNGVVDLTFEEVASLPGPSRKLVLAFFQPNQDFRSMPREELTFPVPVNGLIHVGSSFFCNSADGTGFEANIETGTRIDGSGYVELVATRDIQVGEELLDSYPIWNYGFGDDGDTVSGGNNVEDMSTELLAIAANSDEAQDILDLRRHMAVLKEKVARLEQEKKSNEGKMSGLKRQAVCAASDNRQLKAKVARLTDLGIKKDKDLARKDKEIAQLKTSLYVSFSFQGYRDSSSTEAEKVSEEDNDVVNILSFEPTDVAAFDSSNSGAVSVDLDPLSLYEGEVSGGDTEETYAMSQDDVDFPPLPPLPDETVEIAEGALDATDYESQSRGAPSVDDASNADSNEDFFQAGEDGENDSSGGDDSGGNNADANTSRASDRYNRNEASSGGSHEARPHIGIANPSSNKYIANWNDRYFELIGYNEKHGNCNVPKKSGPNKQLGTWVNNQRAHYQQLKKGKKSSITNERIAKLNEIGFEWDANEAAWEAKLTELIEYKEEHGSCNVPRNDEENKQLGEWVNNQRAHYQQLKKGKKAKITSERIAKLNEIDFVWEANEAAWTARFAELVAYKKAHGDCLVPKQFEANKQLGTWVKEQRYHYRNHRDGKKAKITRERIAKLVEIGFKWKLRG